jgi:hypothetical protein
MSYGQVAVDAVIEFQNQQHQNLLQAWYQALKLNNVSDKVCPRIAFLGLCESGYVVGVPQGNYIQKSTPSVIKQKAVGIRNIIMNTNPPALPTQRARAEGDVDENNHFTSLGNCDRRFLCLGKRD